MIRYFEWNFDTKMVTEFVREGECNGCGQCCVAMIRFNRSIPPSFDDSIQLGDSLGRSGVWFEVQDGEMRRFMQHVAIEPQSRDQACGHLTDDNRCGIHALKNFLADKYALCATWPIHPDQVAAFDQCSYSFTKLAEWTFDEIGTSHT